MNDTFNTKVKQLEDNPITISGIVSSGFLVQGFSSTVYTEKDDATESVVFNCIEVPRLVDVEKEIRDYEEKYKMNSDDFYKNWKMNPAFDNLDFNKWARLYKFLEYAKKN